MERAARDRTCAGVAMAVVAAAMGVRLDEVAGESRTVKAMLARHVAMYLTSVSFSMSYARVAAAVGRDRSTVQYACSVVEDRREDPAFDRWLEALEQALGCSPVAA